MKALEERERTLKALMLSDVSARTGNAFVVEVKEVRSTRFDTTEFRKNYPDLAAEFSFPTTYMRIEPLPISEDGEILRKKRGRSESV